MFPIIGLDLSMDFIMAGLALTMLIIDAIWPSSTFFIISAAAAMSMPPGAPGMPPGMPPGGPPAAPRGAACASALCSARRFAAALRFCSSAAWSLSRCCAASVAASCLTSSQSSFSVGSKSMFCAAARSRFALVQRPSALCALPRVLKAFALSGFICSAAAQSEIAARGRPRPRSTSARLASVAAERHAVAASASSASHRNASAASRSPAAAASAAADFLQDASDQSASSGASATFTGMRGAAASPWLTGPGVAVSASSLTKALRNASSGSSRSFGSARTAEITFWHALSEPHSDEGTGISARAQLGR
mmetsp:Transcript_13998/g.49731  ORF Transcript_13998/g.49731 Transcript_13998/m.49731 type:complete len:308 (-) Transcript_13998:41-964(-)